MANKRYLEEKNLKSSHDRFMWLAEGYLAAPIQEDQPQDDAQQQQPQDGDPNMMGPNAQGPDAPMGGNDMGGGMPPAGGQDGGMGGFPSQDGGAPQDGMPMDQGPDAGMEGGAPQDAPAPDEEGGDMPPIDMPGEGDDESDEDDNVLDVDDLTQAQEKLNDKFNAVGKNIVGMNKTIDKLLGAIDKIQGMVDSNNQEIGTLKAELEKRNPTEQERLNLRSLKQPFNVPPQAYWDAVNDDPNSNYSAYSDNDEPTNKEFEITNNDVDNITDDIAKTFFTPEDDDVTLKKIFNLK